MSINHRQDHNWGASSRNRGMHGGRPQEFPGQPITRTHFHFSSPFRDTSQCDWSDRTPPAVAKCLPCGATSLPGAHHPISPATPWLRPVQPPSSPALRAHWTKPTVETGKTSINITQRPRLPGRLRQGNARKRPKATPPLAEAQSEQLENWRNLPPAPTNHWSLEIKINIEHFYLQIERATGYGKLT